MTTEQIERLLEHLQLLTRRVFAMSDVGDKVALMMSLQEVMAAFRIDE